MMEAINVLVWATGLGFTFFGAVMLILWNAISKMSDKLDRIDQRVQEIDKRLYGIETLLHMKDCCVLKYDENKKIE